MAEHKSSTKKHWLVDDICSYRFQYMSDLDGRRRAESAPRFRVDDVTEYFYGGTDQEEWDLVNDFPCVRPPFDSIWCESDAPNSVVSEKHGVTSWPRGFAAGWAVLMMYARADTPDARSRILKLPDVEAKVLREADEVVGSLMISAWTVSHEAPRPWPDPQASLVLFLNESGGVVPLRANGNSVMTPWFFSPRLESLAAGSGHEPLSDIFRRLIDPCLLAISLLHCKNTIKKEELLPGSGLL